MDTLLLAVPDDVTVPLYRWLPASSPRAALWIAHGLSEHAQRYDDFARELNLAGIAVYAADHPGHGPQAEVAGYFADEDGWARLLARLHAVRNHLAQSHPDLPLILFGHSMGAFAARCYFLQHGAGLAALVLSATGYRQGPMASVMRRLAQLWGKRVGQRTPSKFLARLIFGSFNFGIRPRRTVADWLSRDSKEVDRFLADPWCGGLPTPGLWMDLFGAVRAMERAEKHAAQLARGCPVLLLAGSKDPVSRGSFGLNQLARRYRAAGLRRVKVLVYPGGRHEMHHEINRQQVMHDLLDWLAESGALLA